ncbi:hypothetical protein KBB96_07570 [Luteolibacter ambystomatis]|uniref:Uncharacterized protein n=1 Tax=Luteolibacter ambystomatis TaxID=2824561 RepID=A0A975J2F1_9BACT|nr:hypothetical protein [Luteolibacter ambystomatis]QUE52742.1 hypothetical protein KBB96_07570 [Luteolibacter ambystomatis]
MKEDISDAQEVLRKMRKCFQKRPTGESGLVFDMKHLARQIEGSDFPVDGLNISGFYKYYPFLYVSDAWLFYLFATITYKFIECCIDSDFSFLNEDLISDYLQVSENEEKIRLIVKSCDKLQRRILGDALMSFMNIVQFDSNIHKPADIRRRLIFSADLWNDVVADF